MLAYAFPISAWQSATLNRSPSDFRAGLHNLVFRTNYRLTEGETAIVGRDNPVSQHFEIRLEEASLC